MLTLAHAHGLGVPPDPRRAFAWRLRTAQHGMAEAQYQVGLAYLRGTFVERNLAQAAQWFRSAAEGDVAFAELMLDGLPGKHC